MKYTTHAPSDLRAFSSVHFIGVGGAGMAPLAHLLGERGVAVSGSDQRESVHTRALKESGHRVFLEQHERNVHGASLIVYSTAINEDHCERREARRLGVPQWHRSQMLAALMADSESICVAGTHGKSTTTSMIAHILQCEGRDPSAAIGARPCLWESNHRVGAGPHFVAEADESDGSFRNYRPSLAVILNVAEDHLDYWGNLDAIITGFRDFAAAVPNEGDVLVNADDEQAMSAARGLARPVRSFGFASGADYRLSALRMVEGKPCFRLTGPDSHADFQLSVLGAHNAINMAAAAAAAHELGVPLDRSAEAAMSFAGVARRLSVVYDGTHGTLIDDYAHNPGKVEASIRAVRAAYPDRHLVAVFQPHRYSRLRTQGASFAAALQLADQVLVAPVFSAGEPVDDKAYVDFQAHLAGDACTWTHSEESLEGLWARTMTPGTVMLSLGAGPIDRVATRVIHALGEEHQVKEGDHAAGPTPRSPATDHQGQTEA